MLLLQRSRSGRFPVDRVAGHGCRPVDGRGAMGELDKSGRAFPKHALGLSKDSRGRIWAGTNHGSAWSTRPRDRSKHWEAKIARRWPWRLIPWAIWGGGSSERSGQARSQDCPCSEFRGDGIPLDNVRRVLLDRDNTLWVLGCRAFIVAVTCRTIQSDLRVSAFQPKCPTNSIRMGLLRTTAVFGLRQTKAYIVTGQSWYRYGADK